MMFPSFWSSGLHMCHRFKEENVVRVNLKKISRKTLQTGILSGFPWSIIRIDIDIGVVSLRWWSSPLIRCLIFVFCSLTFLIVLTLSRETTRLFTRTINLQKIFFSLDFHIMRKIFNDSLQVLYVTLYQLWYAQGYQEFAGIESSVTTKVILHHKLPHGITVWSA